MAGESTNGATAGLGGAGVVDSNDTRLLVAQEDVVSDVDPQLPVELLKRAQELSGKPPVNKTPRDKLVETHNAHVKRQLGQQKATNLVKKPILALAYSASYKPLKDLQKIFLKDLLVEEHHEGKVLFLRTITPPYQGAGTVVVVEDENKDADKMGVYNQSDASIVSIIPEGSVVAVKEPYYKYNGHNDYMVCVDQPSDIVYLKFDDPAIPEPFRLPDGETDTPADWKDAGDKAFLAKSLPIATLCYSRAIETYKESDKAFLTDVYGKRASSNLMMKRFDNAIADAKASLKGKDSDSQAYFVAGKAAYGLGDFEEARKHYQNSLQKKPGDARVTAELQRCERRLEEAATGCYDFKAMAQQTSAKNIWVDAASFLGNTRIADSPFHGRGLFATKDLKAGDLIFAEKAVCCPNEFNIEHNSAALFANLVRACQDNPSVHKKVLDLYGGSYKRSGSEGKVVDETAVVDVFLLESIRRKNCFSGPRVNDQMWTDWSIKRDGMHRGLWAHASYANHACMPNSNRSFIGDMLILTATMDIPKDTEITQIYLSPKAVVEYRAQQFLNWGFDCHCRLCATEAKSPKENHEKRKKVLAELETTLRKKQATKFQPDATIRPIEKLTRQLDSLHEEDVYASIPRLTLVWPTMWLLQAYHTRGNNAKTARWAVAALRNFGFINPIKNGAVTVYKEGSTGITTFEVVKALKFASDAYGAMGDDVLSAEFREAARTGYKTISGFDDNFPAVDANPKNWV